MADWTRKAAIWHDVGDGVVDDEALLDDEGFRRQLPPCLLPKKGKREGSSKGGASTTSDLPLGKALSEDSNGDRTRYGSEKAGSSSHLRGTVPGVGRETNLAEITKGVLADDKGAAKAPFKANIWNDVGDCCMDTDSIEAGLDERALPDLRGGGRKGSKLGCTASHGGRSDCGSSQGSARSRGSSRYSKGRTGPSGSAFGSGGPSSSPFNSVGSSSAASSNGGGFFGSGSPSSRAADERSLRGVTQNVLGARDDTYDAQPEPSPTSQRKRAEPPAPPAILPPLTAVAWQDSEEARLEREIEQNRKCFAGTKSSIGGDDIFGDDPFSSRPVSVMSGLSSGLTIPDDIGAFLTANEDGLPLRSPANRRNAEVEMPSEDRSIPAGGNARRAIAAATAAAAAAAALPPMGDEAPRIEVEEENVSPAAFRTWSGTAPPVGSLVDAAPPPTPVPANRRVRPVSRWGSEPSTRDNPGASAAAPAAPLPAAIRPAWTSDAPARDAVAAAFMSLPPMETGAPSRPTAEAFGTALPPERPQAPIPARRPLRPKPLAAKAPAHDPERDGEYQEIGDRPWELKATESAASSDRPPAPASKLSL